jgi:hypothetical protein
LQEHHYAIDDCHAPHSTSEHYHVSLSLSSHHHATTLVFFATKFFLTPLPYPSHAHPADTSASSRSGHRR